MSERLSVATPAGKAAGACASGGNTARLIWKVSPYPERGPYGFVPGLVDIAFASPKKADAFLRESGTYDATRGERDPGWRRTCPVSTTSRQGWSPS